MRAGYLLDVSKAGSYQMIFKMHSGENPFAQLPVSIFVNGVLQQTTTFNGTDNKIIERAVTISFPESRGKPADAVLWRERGSHG